jgi:hypothetical protein
MKIDWWRAFPFAVCLLFWLVALMVMLGCASPTYQPVPAWLVPIKPTVPTVTAAELICLSDDTYLRLAERDRACWQHVRELRAVLGVAR